MFYYPWTVWSPNQWNVKETISSCKWKKSSFFPLSTPWGIVATSHNMFKIKPWNSSVLKLWITQADGSFTCNLIGNTSFIHSTSWLTSGYLSASKTGSGFAGSSAASALLNQMCYSSDVGLLYKPGCTEPLSWRVHNQMPQ